MGDRRYDREEPKRPRRDDPERELSLGEAIDLSVRKVVTAIVIAGGLVAVGAYMGGGRGASGPNYQITAANGRLYRVDTDNGQVIACDNERCTIVLHHGQRLVDELPDLPPAAAAPPPQPVVSPALPSAPPPAQLPAPTPTPAR